MSDPNTIGTQQSNASVLQQMSNQQDDEHFSSLVNFNNYVSQSHPDDFSHTTGSQGGAAAGGSDQYNANDGSVSYKVTNNNNGTTTLAVSKPGDNGTPTYTVFDADGSADPAKSAAVQTSAQMVAVAKADQALVASTAAQLGN